MSLKTTFTTVIAALALAGFSQGKTISCPLDALAEIPTNWKMTQDEFEKKFTKENAPYYKWLTKDRTRAKIARRFYSNVELDLSLFDGEVQVEEAIVDFAGGTLNLISFSIYNRGDGRNITEEDFTASFTASGKAMSKSLAVKPNRKDANLTSGLLTAGFSWFSPENGIALLEHNDKALSGGDREFLRLRIARPNAEGSLAASMTHSRGGAAVKMGDLQDNVVKDDNGDVYLSNMPMVDQGDKGYCVVASTQRVFEYYGIGADMHQIAQVTDANPDSGTSSHLMASALDRIDYRFKTRLEIIGMGHDGALNEPIKKRDTYYVGKPVDEKKFLKEVRSYINSGLPLLWSLNLGLYPEEPKLSEQVSGGHMRLIIGYNDKTEEIIFSDSWGFGHEMKRISMSNAYKASTGVFVLKPTTN